MSPIINKPCDQSYPHLSTSSVATATRRLPSGSSIATKVYCPDSFERVAQHETLHALNMSLTREQVVFADLAKAMKKTVARQANGKSFRCQELSSTSLLTCALARIRFRLRNPTDDQSRKQVEEEGKICSPGQAGPSNWACSLQRGTLEPHVRASTTMTIQRDVILIRTHRRLNMQDTSAL